MSFSTDVPFLVNLTGVDLLLRMEDGSEHPLPSEGEVEPGEVGQPVQSRIPGIAAPVVTGVSYGHPKGPLPEQADPKGLAFYIITPIMACWPTLVGRPDILIINNLEVTGRGKYVVVELARPDPPMPVPRDEQVQAVVTLALACMDSLAKGENPPAPPEDLVSAMEDIAVRSNLILSPKVVQAGGPDYLFREIMGESWLENVRRAAREEEPK